MGVQPVRLALAPVGAGEGVIGRSQHRHKDLSRAGLACIRVHDVQRGTAIVNEQLLPDPV